MALPTKITMRNEIAGIETFSNGGKGSGFYGHYGRPGEVGGSSSVMTAVPGERLSKHMADTARKYLEKDRAKLVELQEKRKIAEQGLEMAVEGLEETDSREYDKALDQINDYEKEIRALKSEMEKVQKRIKSHEKTIARDSRLYEE